MNLKYLLPLLAVAGAAVAAVEVEHGERVSPPPAPPAAMPESPFADAVAGVGLVEASSENISVGSPTAGVVMQVFVKVGDHVKAGAPLFRLDDRTVQADLGLKRAAVDVAEANLDNARYDLSVAEKLMEKKVETVNNLDQKRFAVRKSEAALVLSKADVAVGETNLKLLRVGAPVTGEILQLKVHPGEFAPDASSASSQPSVLIGSVAPLNVRAEFDESDAPRVRAGASAVGFLRGNARVRIPVTFVRFEPYVIPKVSLTGNAAERTDTRVLQVVYAIGESPLPVYAGQQMDVYVDAAAR